MLRLNSPQLRPIRTAREALEFFQEVVENGGGDLPLLSHLSGGSYDGYEGGHIFTVEDMVQVGDHGPVVRDLGQSWNGRGEITRFKAVTL